MATDLLIQEIPGIYKFSLKILALEECQVSEIIVVPMCWKADFIRDSTSRKLN
jgi:hypothetical protein